VSFERRAKLGKEEGMEGGNEPLASRFEETEEAQSGKVGSCSIRREGKGEEFNKSALEGEGKEGRKESSSSSSPQPTS